MWLYYYTVLPDRDGIHNADTEGTETVRNDVDNANNGGTEIGRIRVVGHRRFPLLTESITVLFSIVKG